MAALNSTNPINAYRQTQKEAQDTLVLQYMPAVRAMAFRLKERLPSSIDVNDLISIGTEELIKLSRRYDKEQNDSFWGYGKKRVYGAMLDYLRGLDVVSRSNRRLIKSIDNEISRYLGEYEVEPDDAHLAKVLGESIEKIKEARQAGTIVANLPLSDQLSVYHDTTTEEIIETEQVLDKIKAVLSTFGERDQLIIQLYYFEELNLKEISDILGISESRISQIHKKLLQQLRESLGGFHG